MEKAFIIINKYIFCNIIYFFVNAIKINSALFTLISAVKRSKYITLSANIFIIVPLNILVIWKSYGKVTFKLLNLKIINAVFESQILWHNDSLVPN